MQFKYNFPTQSNEDRFFVSRTSQTGSYITFYTQVLKLKVLDSPRYPNQRKMINYTFGKFVTNVVKQSTVHSTNF